MNSKGKTASFILCAILAAVLVYQLYSDSNAAKKEQYLKQLQTYNSYMEKQSEATGSQLQKYNEQIEFTDKINKKAMENQERFEKLLERWEAQADKMDIVLNKIDKK